MKTKTVYVSVIVLILVTLACGSSTRQNDQNQSPDVPDISGDEVFQRSGCSGCHDGASGIAPSLHGVYGTEVLIENGETVMADEAYLRESILSPNEKIVEGYAPIMPSFENQLTEGELEALVAYIRTLDN